MKEPFAISAPAVGLGEEPYWWHHHGVKMKFEGTNTSGPCHIKSNSSNLAMTRIIGIDKALWKLQWFIRHEAKTTTLGVRYFEDDELLAAFGISQKSGDHGDEIISRFGAHSAVPGKFIRWQNYLNIPGPGIGHDGDPNISILVTDDIKERVRVLVENSL